MPFFIKPITSRVAGGMEDSFIQPNIKMHLEYIQSMLKSSGGPFLCGSQLTTADILMTFPLQGLMLRAGLSKENYPEIVAYHDLLMEQPGWKRSVVKITELDGEYKPML